MEPEELGSAPAESPSGEKAFWERFMGEDVVIDTRSSFVYIGRLVSADEGFIELAEVDVHDRAEGQSTNEKYILDAKKYGIKRNRHRVFVRLDHVLSISRLADVVEY
jgi:small nuclear ribonucleoprotein (snRNP)-like protein